MNVGELKKRLEGVDDDKPVVLAVPESWMNFKGNHQFENGNRFHIYETELGFLERVNWVDDDEGKWQTKAFVIT